MERKTIPTSPQSEARQKADEKRAARQAHPHVMFAAIVFSLLFGTLAGLFGFAIAASVPSDWPVIGRLNVFELFEARETQVLLSTRRQKPSVVEQSPQVVKQLAAVYTGIPYQDEDAQALGTAVVITTDGWLIVPTSVLSDAATTVLFENGMAYAIEEQMEYGTSGFSFIRIDADDLNPAQYSTTTRLEPGQTVWTIEQSVGDYAVYERQVTGQEIAATQQTTVVDMEYVLNAEGEQHVAGTPVYRSDATVAGIVTAEGRVYPGSAIAGLVQSKQQGLGESEPTLVAEYVNLALVPEVVREENELPSNGFWIRSIERDDTEQFEENDVITYINNTFVEQGMDLSAILHAKPAGSTFYVTIVREGTEEQTQFTF